MRTSDTLLAVSYCGSHVKSTGPIDPAAHERMLTASVRHYGASFPVVIVATDYHADSFDGITVCSVGVNPGHQLGAAWCIKLALDHADAHGFDYLFMVADDVALSVPEIHAALAVLRTGFDYVGSNWANSGGCFNTQVFGCRVESYRRLFSPDEFGGHYMLEQYLHDISLRRGLTGAIRAIDYQHTHDPDFYFRLLEMAAANSQ